MSEPADVTCAIVLAAGEGRRMGADKALLSLGKGKLVAKVVEDCLQASVSSVVVVRREGSDPLPNEVLDLAQLQLQLQLKEVPAGGEMIDSLRAGLDGLPPQCRSILVFPVDYGLAGAEVVAAVVAKLRASGASVVLPLYGERPGHPIGLSRELEAEIMDPETKTLRDVIAKDPERVATIPVSNPWVLRDLDTPDDLRAAVSWLEMPQALRTCAVTELMRAHRSRRAFHADPVPQAQLERLVDAARHASTSSFIQAYSVVAVREQERKAKVQELCANQGHIAQAPLFLAVCADLHKIALSCELRRVDIRAESLEIFLQATIDAALLGQNLLLAAESEGLGGCMIGAAREHPVQLARLLELPPLVYVVFGMVLGRPADDPVARRRMRLGAVLHDERYQCSGLEEALSEMDSEMRAWAKQVNRVAERSAAERRGEDSGRRVNEAKGWTHRVAAQCSRDRGLREALLAELRQLGFGF